MANGSDSNSVKTSSAVARLQLIRKSVESIPREVRVRRVRDRVVATVDDPLAEAMQSIGS